METLFHPRFSACGVQATKYYTIDSGIALFVAFLINLAVVCSFAKQFYDKNCATASTTSACFVGESIDLSQPTYGTCDDGEGVCQEIGLSAAAAALKGSLGKAAKYVWAVGLLVRRRLFIYTYLVLFVATLRLQNVLLAVFACRGFAFVSEYNSCRLLAFIVLSYN